MADQPFQLDGQQLAKICKRTLPGRNDDTLLSRLQSLNPDYPVRVAKTGEEWYRLGGIVDMAGNRIANDLIEWTERTYIECGKNLQTLIDHAREQKLIATRQTGNTLHFVIQTGCKAEQFIQIDIDKTREMSDRLLVGEHNPPEDLEEFIDPLIPESMETFCIGAARYSYRRKTDVAIFMDEINKYHLEEHPVQRFIDDWNRSSALQKAVLSDDWIVRPFRHTGRFGEQQINIEIINTQQKNMPQMGNLNGKKGVSLHNLLSRFDRQAGYPFAWFFYMVKGKLVTSHSGVAVFKDVSGDFSYLPERDIAVLKDWVNSPYSV
ncbi:conserved hypothetical protein [Candidatus Methylobacter favarea]|uniref:Uncharacterized protein n=1 Tax=Candidatus Methylobacter favarea TaxID=2707345 RepID=A0A8S0Y9G0_9GAMM|nr:hypothetical protein [Candidatus Methylobacter favarea]CAA9890088.1 conserved hypothetical protein [Candidatus Methylobacter favarea]